MRYINSVSNDTRPYILVDVCEVWIQYSGSRGRARSFASPIHRLERSVSYYDGLPWVEGATHRVLRC